MNSLDFIICLVLIAYFVSYRKKSFIYNFMASIGLFAGYLGGLYVVPQLTRNFNSDLKKGMVSLLVILATSLICCLGGIYLGSKARIKIIASSLFKLDKILAIPYKILAAVIGIIILSQSLIYVPILSLQFVAQGSSVIYLTSKFVPNSFIAIQTQKIDPDQFSLLQLNYDPAPINFANIGDAGTLQAEVNDSAPSVVKVSGINCEGREFGTGFSVGRGLFVTNAHVIAGSSTIYLRDRSGAYPATPIYVDVRHDIAVLYSRFVNLPPLTLSDTKAPAGLNVAVLGYPLGGNLKATTGLVLDHSDVNFNPVVTKLNADNTLTLNALVQPGNSGSPVLDNADQAVGVVNALDTDTNNSIAIDSNLVAQLVASAKSRLFPTSTDLCGVFSGYN